MLKFYFNFYEFVLTLKIGVQLNSSYALLVIIEFFDESYDFLFLKVRLEIACFLLCRLCLHKFMSVFFPPGNKFISLLLIASMLFLPQFFANLWLSNVFGRFYFHSRLHIDLCLMEGGIFFSNSVKHIV